MAGSDKTSHGASQLGRFPGIEGNDGETGENMMKNVLMADDEEGILELVSRTLAGDER